MNRSGAQRLTRRISTYLSRGTRARHHEPAPAFQLEPLEQRLLLDATFIDMTYANAWQVLPLNSAGQYAMFEAIRPGTATGTGLINSCVKLNADKSTGVEQGYNTDASTSGDTVLHDVQGAHSLLLNDLPSVKVAGQWYREFWLDVVESPEYVSLDKLQIFLGDGPALTGYSGFGGHALKIFDLDTDLAAADATGGAWMGLRDLNAGSGQGDYRFFIPEALFSGHAGYNYVYLYSKLGGDGVSKQVQGGGTVGNWKADSGGEEWFVFKTGAARGTISGYKFNDLNGNGVDNSEPRLNGWTIELYKENDGNTTFDAGDTFVTSMVTSGLGTYGFIGLQLGSYYVREKPSAAQVAEGWTQKTTNPPLITLHTDDFIDPSTSGYAGLAFGNACYGTISGKKFHDLNANGIFDVGTDSVLSGWWIYAYKDVNGNSVLDSGDTLADSEQTSSEGLYSFDLQPGKYILVEESRTGWQQSKPTSDVDGSAKSRAENGYAITVTSGGSDSDNDFGNYQQVSISGVKFEDLDADGLAQEAGESGLSGWWIYAYNDVNGNGLLDSGDTLADSQQTGSEGQYSFSLNPGKYLIVEENRTGWLQSRPTSDIDGSAKSRAENGFAITLTSGGSDSDNNFGNWTTASVSGVKFEDLNANHAKDAGEPGLSGWTIFVDYNDDGDADAGEPSTVTGADGSYIISGIVPGTWKVKEVLQAGWTQSYPVAGYYSETFLSHDALTGKNFGNWTLASVSGVKFEDLNADGVKDTGEPGLSGWTIFVDYNDNDAVDTDEPSAVTSSGGSYTISGIKPGTWKIKEVLQAGWTQSYPTSGYDEETFTSHAALTDKNFGNWTPASVSGVKFEDLNADGVKDSGEPGLSGWTIFVDYNNNGAVDTDEPSALTGSGGSYTISGIKPGTWKIKEVLQTGWTQSYPTSGYDEETFTSHAAVTDKNFGNWRSAGFGGVKFEDSDGDGSKDSTESGLENWVIRAYADLNGNGVLDQADYDHGVIDSDTTDSGTGAYYLDLEPGRYIVVEVLQSNWHQSGPATDVVGAVLTGGEVLGQNGYAITLTSHQEDNDNDFANYRKATISGYKYEDMDADGNLSEDTGQPLAGWEIHLDGTDGLGQTVHLTDTTDALGSYEFSVAPGIYAISEVGQTGWTQSYPDVPGDSDHDVTPTSGQSLTDQNFGNWTTASVSGVKFEDLNADGVKDTDEPGLSGWTIFVDYNDNGAVDSGEPSALTGSGGSYTISGIKPGTWKIKEVLQSGWTQSYPTSGYDEEIFTSHATLTDKNFGNWTLASVSGVKFEDLNANGIKDVGDPGLGGFVIRAYADLNGDGDLDQADYDNGVIDSDTTASGTGAYYLDLNPGKYIIVEVLQTGYSQTLPTADVVGVVTTKGEVLGQDGYAVTLTSGQEDNDNNFGNFKNINLSGFKWLDADHDGQWDSGEQGVNGWTIVLDTNSSYNPTDPTTYIRKITTTNYNGNPGYYEFLNITAAEIDGADTLYVYEDQTDAPLGQWTQTYPASGYYTVGVASGQVVAGTYRGTEKGNFGNFVVQTGALLPTQTTVQMYASHNWPTMYDAFHYQAKGDKITSVSPGVIFYYNTVTAPSAEFTIDVSQWNTAGWDHPMLAQPSGRQLQAYLYDASFHVVTTGVVYKQPGDNDPSHYTIRFTVEGATAEATYYIGIKYAPTNLKGQTLKNAATSEYFFETWITYDESPEFQWGSGASIAVEHA